MKRCLALLLFALLVSTSAGCIAAIGNTASPHVSAQHRQVVEVDDEIYVVDVSTGTSYLVDKSSALPATELDPIDCEDDD